MGTCYTIFHASGQPSRIFRAARGSVAGKLIPQLAVEAGRFEFQLLLGPSVAMTHDNDNAAKSLPMESYSNPATVVAS